MKGISKTSGIHVINLILFSLASDRLFKKGFKVATLLTKIPQKQSLSHFLKLFSTETM